MEAFFTVLLNDTRSTLVGCLYPLIMIINLSTAFVVLAWKLKILKLTKETDDKEEYSSEDSAEEEYSSEESIPCAMPLWQNDEAEEEEEEDEAGEEEEEGELEETEEAKETVVLPVIAMRSKRKRHVNTQLASRNIIGTRHK